MRNSVLKKCRRLRSWKSYTTAELAKSLEVHPRTIRTWMESGLEPLDRRSRPFLFMGFEVKQFAHAQTERLKSPLSPEQLYCAKCKSGQVPVPGGLRIVWLTEARGPKCLINLQAACRECGSTMNRFTTLERALISFPQLLSDGSDLRLCEAEIPPLNAIMEVVSETEPRR